MPARYGNAFFRRVSMLLQTDIICADKIVNMEQNRFRVKGKKNALPDGL